MKMLRKVRSACSPSRREFFRWSAGAALACAVSPLKAQIAERGETGGGRGLAVVNSSIHTVDERRPTAQAFLVRHGRFAAVGTNEEIRGLITRSDEVVDAAGATIVPGFIDAHCHPASSGIAELLDVDCNRRSIAQIKAAIRERAATMPAGSWVLGFKYDDTKLTDGRPLARVDLDEAAPEHPVRVEHRGGHTAVVNSLALKAAGVDRNTPDPVGGKFGRVQAGELTGFVAEKANDLIDRAVRRLPATPAQRQAGVKRMSELMTAAGLTSVHSVATSKNDVIAYQDALAAGEMLFRVYVLAQPAVFRSWVAAGIRPGFGNERLRLGGIKLFSDGSASERTMRMSQPYVGRPNDYGILTITQDELNEQVREAHEAGFQVGVHANGDVAIDMVLTAYELAQRLHPRTDARHRIEHCTLVNPELLRRIAALGVIPTPFYTYVYYHGDKWEQYGDERLRWMFAHRSFLDYGIKVAGASDYVPGPFEPLMAIQSMVTRKDYRGRVWGENQKITVAEALKICTLHGAHASHEEHFKGSISVGKLADFVMLADDPHKVEPGRIKDIRVLRTVVGGQTVFSSTG
jgi:predicted amidohydrolase YtcJ